MNLMVDPLVQWVAISMQASLRTSRTGVEVRSSKLKLSSTMESILVYARTSMIERLI